MEMGGIFGVVVKDEQDWIIAGTNVGMRHGGSTRERGNLKRMATRGPPPTQRALATQTGCGIGGRVAHFVVDWSMGQTEEQ